MFRKGPLLTKIGKNQAKAGSRVRLGALVIRFWGSNCRCYVIAIIKSEERFWEDEGKFLKEAEKVLMKDYEGMDIKARWIC